MSLELDDQFLRVCTLVVSNKQGAGIDLSELRIKFSVKRSDTMTPNMADIRVYNLSTETALMLSNKKEFTTITLQAGYQGNFGVIFQGNIKQVIIGRENATDTFVDFIAGDGDRAYNFSILNQTIAKGLTQTDQANAAIAAMGSKGVTPGFSDAFEKTSLPRGKTFFGNARDHLRSITQSNGKNWSIQDGKVNILDKKAYLPGERVVLTSKTGMIGTPSQTNEGVNVKCLLNPNIKIAGRIQIDNKSIQKLKINLSVPNSAANIPAPLTADGTYYVLVVEHQGDTRGVEWYSNLICLNMDVTTNPLNSVQVGYNP